MRTFTRSLDKAVDALGALAVVGGWVAWLVELAVATVLGVCGRVLAVDRCGACGWPIAAVGVGWLVALLTGRLRPGWWCPPFW